MLKTEADSPGRYPELGYRVPILDIAVWVVEEDLHAPGMEDKNLHRGCEGGECLAIAEPNCNTERLEGGTTSSTRILPQVQYRFYLKPSAAKTTILSIYAKPMATKENSFPTRGN